MLRFEQCITQRDAEMIIVDVVQEHVDATEVVGRLVDLLTEETLLHVLFADDFCNLHEKRTGTAGGVIDLAHLGLVERCDTCKELADLLWCEELTAGLACIACVHLHEELIRIAERINSVLFRSVEIHVSNRIQNTCETLVTLINR